jgi:flagellar motor switch protein FliG
MKPIINEISSAQKAAILLVALGPKNAANIIKLLDPTEIKKIAFWIDQTQEIDPSLAHVVVKEVYNLIQQKEEKTSLCAGRDFLKKALNDAVGPDQTENFLKGLEAPENAHALEILSHADLHQLCHFLDNEGSQTIALMLLFIDVNRSIDIFSGLQPPKQMEILINLANLELYNTNSLFGVLRAAAKALGYHGKEDRFEKETALNAARQIYHGLDNDLKNGLMEMITSKYFDDGERIKSFYYRSVESTY